MSQFTSVKHRSRTFRTLKYSAIFAFLAILMLSIFAQDAHAVRVSMKRAIFSGSKKSEVITLINTTAKEQTYRLGWKRFRMDEHRSLRAIEKNDPGTDIQWAEKMVRYAPRRITVPAGGSQQVRILLRRPKGIEEGEYRAHLWIVSEGKPPEFDPNPDPTKQEIRLAVQPAISLPIFVRHGDLNAEVSITDTALKTSPEGLNVSLTLNRQGTRSIYGDFDFICTDGGKNVVLKEVRGIAVYTEVNRRLLEFDLPLNESTTSSCNTVSITYRADTDDPQFKGATLAETAVSR